MDIHYTNNGYYVLSDDGGDIILAEYGESQNAQKKIHDLLKYSSQYTVTSENGMASVRSVQRGVYAVSGINEHFINIHPVNPTKCVLLLDSPYYVTNPTPFFSNVKIERDKIVIDIGTNYVSRSFNWQLVEFM